ncbi:MAG: hypothetical protein ACLQUY_24565 [Ktedonobacterales bacterium]
MSTSQNRLRLLGTGTGILLVAALAVLAGCGSQTTGETQPTATTAVATATPTHPAGAVVTTPISGITMFSATTGWGSVQTSGIAYTVDGGHTWYNVTPPVSLLQHNARSTYIPCRPRTRGPGSPQHRPPSWVTPLQRVPVAAQPRSGIQPMPALTGEPTPCPPFW